MFQQKTQLYSRVPATDQPGATPAIDSAERSFRKFGFLLCIVASIFAVGTLGKNLRQVVVFEDESKVPFLAVHSPIDDPDPSSPLPHIAWLMSFPNSGTSFTMRMVGRVTGLSAATNYGKECVEKSGNYSSIVPVYEDSPGGPFVLSPDDRELPEHYIMTKTHCGGRCQSCGPKKYIETPDSFLDWCLRGGKYETKIGSHGKEKMEFVNTWYDEKLIQRAIHLIRDPFDNLVSRFHLEQHEKKKSNRTEWLERYPSSAEGFQAWCGDMDGKLAKQEKESKLLDDKVKSLFKKIPCHGDFYRYTQWHNLALNVVHNLELPTLVVHYENYETNYDGSVDKILDFLDLPRNNELPEFIAGKRYRNIYFNDEQRMAALELMRYLADEETWSLLERYDDQPNSVS